MRFQVPVIVWLLCVISLSVGQSQTSSSVSPGYSIPTIDLNGQNIVDIQLDATPVRDRPARGYIGLQDHGRPNDLRFRKIWLKEL